MNKRNPASSPFDRARFTKYKTIISRKSLFDCVVRITQTINLNLNGYRWPLCANVLHLPSSIDNQLDTSVMCQNDIVILAQSSCVKRIQGWTLGTFDLRNEIVLLLLPNAKLNVLSTIVFFRIIKIFYKLLAVKKNCSIIK